MSSPTIPKTKVAIVGAGCVGSTTAYALMLSGTVSHIALIDAKKEKAEGELLDLAHCMQFTSSVQLSAGDDFALVKDAAIVVIAAGVAQKPGQTRSDLLNTNVTIFKEMIPKIVAQNKDCILLVVTNPLDVLTYVTWKLSGFPSCRIFGSGTVLDTARLRYALGQHFQVSPKDVTAYILGEHGDSEFVWWSNASIAGAPLTSFDTYSKTAMNQIYEQTKQAAYQIIQKKGATFYAIALIVTKIIRAIVLNQSRVFSVSTLVSTIPGIDELFLSVPTILRQSGVCQHLDLALTEQEQSLLLQSAQKINQELEQARKQL